MIINPASAFFDGIHLGHRERLSLSKKIDIGNSFGVGLMFS
jgi:FAD synthase